jgi:4'-phosphopantetheinyl transferase
MPRATQIPNRNSPKRFEFKGLDLNPGALTLEENEIHLWSGRFEMFSTEQEILRGLLCETERERLARFRFEIHQRRFIAARGQLRTILSRYLACEPGQIQFRYNHWGKPSIDRDEFEFNLSHSEENFLLAVSRKPVGVDIEAIRATNDLELMAQTVFSKVEWVEWSRLSSSEKIKSFYEIWTRKEALLKGIGCGITEHCPNSTVKFTGELPLFPPEISALPWRIVDLASEPGFAMALATPLNRPVLHYKAASSQKIRKAQPLAKVC